MFRTHEIPSADRAEIDRRHLRMNVVGMVKRGNLSREKERRAIDLLLGFKGAIPDKELERLYEKLMLKSLKK